MTGGRRRLILGKTRQAWVCPRPQSGYDMGVDINNARTARPIVDAGRRDEIGAGPWQS